MKTITITLTVPDGVEVQVAHSAPTHETAAVAPVCPKHGSTKVAPSKFGGFYCKAADDSEERGYCTWTG